jgi:hemerythrin-like domain-containing protein
MKEYFNKGVKDIISQFPKIADILKEYNIGCISCSVGNCILKDIVTIHNLPKEEEIVMMAKISQVLYPNKKIEIPEIEKKKNYNNYKIKYSPPIKKLVDEHVVIKKLISLIPKIIKHIDLEPAINKDIILSVVDFIRSYADKYHHAKEEDILFKYFDKNSDILKTMYNEHERGRAHVKAIIDGVAKKDKISIKKHLKEYAELLTEHIKKEDEILYPWMDRNISVTKVGELFSKFNEVDDHYPDITRKYKDVINNLEEYFLILN